MPFFLGKNMRLTPHTPSGLTHHKLRCMMNIKKKQSFRAVDGCYCVVYFTTFYFNDGFEARSWKLCEVSQNQNWVTHAEKTQR